MSDSRVHWLLVDSPHHKLQVQEEVAGDVVVVADCEDGEGSVLVWTGGSSGEASGYQVEYSWPTRSLHSTEEDQSDEIYCGLHIDI